MGHLNFYAIAPYFRSLPEAIAITLWLSVIVIVLSTAFGILGAILRTRSNALVRCLLIGYVEVMRNVPLLALLYIFYFSLPQFGVRLSGFTCAALAITLNSTAYMIEIFRGGLSAIPSGQYEAANSQGMRTVQIYRFIILPQLLRIVYAPVGNQVIACVIGTSAASIVTVPEVTAWMESTGASTFRFFEVFLVIAVVYLVLCQAINFARVVIGWLLFRRMEDSRP
jgi:His/Glu/Gln/Arg/opine family amino acid ABC transporter permease subunit